MKNSNRIYYLAAFFLPLLLLSGCAKDFLERPPKSSIVDANFYQTDDQVLAGTSLLYNEVWFDYNDKASYNLGDFRSGTTSSAYNDRGNVLFNTTGDTPENGSSWRSFFIVVGQSNLAIQNINRYAGDGVSPNIKRTAIAEARFMRALAYRFLVMNWGPVPIIENNLTLLSDTTIQRNTVESVWKFITDEMRAVANDLPETAVKEGRVTKWSAEAMLARFYLTRAGVGMSGSRNQSFLDSAKYYAGRVIQSGAFGLMSNYADLFKYPYDNNKESIFELQWVYSPGLWGFQNSTPAYLAYSSDIDNGNGWGGDKSATFWMLSQYEGFKPTASGDTLIGRTVDQRLKATYMLPGFSYPEITQTLHNPDGEQPLVFPFTGTDNNFASIKKYVTGKAKDVGGNSASQDYPNDTYMMRFAEVLLIYTEATLGNTDKTTDATAVGYFNQVHQRAGLPQVDSVTTDMLRRERFIEFAMEGMGWYDLVSLHYYDPEAAYAILNSQDRGLFFAKPDQFPNPTKFWFIKTPWATTDRTIHAYDGNFNLPIPTAELSQAPNLSKEPTDYVKK